MNTFSFEPGRQKLPLPPQFVPEFTPERLLPDKNLWLCVAPDGNFFIKRNLREEVPDLSETDHLVFLYFCFMHMCRCFTAMGKAAPIEIPDFSDRLDESVDFNALLRRGEAICGQKITVI